MTITALDMFGRRPPRSEILPSPGDPMAVAGKVLDAFQADDLLTLRRWRGGWMRWDGPAWTEIEEQAVRAILYERLEYAAYEHATKEGAEERAWRPDRRKISDLADAIAAKTFLHGGINPPSWLDDGMLVPASEIVACANGLLHVGTRKLLGHTPAYFNRVAVPFDYDPRAGEPKRWLRFLGELWPNDPESIAALGEFFGYVLSGRTDLHKILLLVGPTRSGKGTIARILGRLIGAGNVAGPTLASLGTDFGLAPLLGSPLAIVADARLGGTNAHQVVERLLSISGEDTLTVNRKYREQWTGKLPTRFVILSNELPRFGDASGAIANRFIVLNMTESFLGREDTRLTDALSEELPAILGWALDGLDRLSAARSFTTPDASTEAVTMLQDLVSPVAAFVRDQCDIVADAEIAVVSLYDAWKQWAGDNGHRVSSVQTFGRDLRAVAPSVRVIRPRDGDNRERHYRGVRLGVAHSGEVRGPSRTGESSGPVVRSGPRTNPLSAQPSQCRICDQLLMHPQSQGRGVCAKSECLRAAS